MQTGDQVGRELRARQIREITADTAGRWIEPYRSADHGDLLYDRAGLPR